MRWTPDQYAAYLAKAGTPKDSKDTPDPGPESVLQGKILKWAKDHGYPCLSFRQSKKAQGFIVPGWPDITLVLPSRVIFLELKNKTGRLSEEQEQFKIMFLHLKAGWFEVRSFKRFLEIVKGG